MSKNFLGVKMPLELRNELDADAKSKGITTSELVRNICMDYLNEKKTEAQMVTSIQAEVIQIEGMLSMMHAFNQQIYATILGRTAKRLTTEDDKATAKKNKEQAEKAIQSMLAKAAAEVLDGENVWGEIIEKK